jgi:hypothetical protein
VLMLSDCGPAGVFAGLFFSAIGALLLVTGVQCWIRPSSALVEFLVLSRFPRTEDADPISKFFGNTREKGGVLSLYVWRFLGIFNGSVFLGAGVWLESSQVGCALQLPAVRSIVGSLSWRQPGWYWVLFIAAIGMLNAYRLRPIFREVYLVLAIVFAVAAGETVAFHAGVQASRWFTIAAVTFALSGVVWLLNKNHSKST